MTSEDEPHERREERENDRSDQGLPCDEGDADRHDVRGVAALLLIRELPPDVGDDAPDREGDRNRGRQEHAEADRSRHWHPGEATNGGAVRFRLLCHAPKLENDPGECCQDGRRDGAGRHRREPVLHHDRERRNLLRGGSGELARICTDPVGRHEPVERERKEQCSDRGGDELHDHEGCEAAAALACDPERHAGVLGRRLRIRAHLSSGEVLQDVVRPQETEHELRRVRHERDRTVARDRENTKSSDDEEGLDQDHDEHLQDRHVEPRRLQDSEKRGADGEATPEKSWRDLLVREARGTVRLRHVRTRRREEWLHNARERGEDHEARGGPHEPLDQKAEVVRGTGVLRHVPTTLRGE